MTAPRFGDEGSPLDRARFLVVPVPYEATTTYRKGTAEGPGAILDASMQIELYDEETRGSPLDVGVAVLDPVVCDGMPDVLAARLRELLAPHLDAGKVVGCLGGEHSISLGPIQAVAARHPGVGILQVDAHPDLRDSYEGTRYGHGCVMRRVLDDPTVGALVQVGLRAVSHEDDEAMRGDARVRPFYAHAIARRPAANWIEEVVDALPDEVYVSFDLDGLDPSILPGTGTPEPGGLLWWDACALLRTVIARKRLVGFDVVELIPEPPSNVSSFAAARLVMKFLAYAGAA
jgi:agmatinase